MTTMFRSFINEDSFNLLNHRNTKNTNKRRYNCAGYTPLALTLGTVRTQKMKMAGMALITVLTVEKRHGTRPCKR